MPPKKAAAKAGAAAPAATAAASASVNADASPANETPSNAEGLPGSQSPRSSEPAVSANVQRVLIPKLEVKKIVSHHSATILSEPDPIVHLEEEGLVDKAIAAFKGAAESDDLLPKDKLPAVVSSLAEHSIDVQKLSVLISDSFPTCPDRIELSVYLDFLTRFLAPAFEYGQHFRLYSCRGCIPEMQKLALRLCPVHTGDGEGLTAAHHACEFNRPDVLDALITMTAKPTTLVNAQDRYGWSPLHCAAHHGSIACVKRLIGLNADLQLKNVQGKTALHLACAQNRSAIVFLLLQAQSDLLHSVDKMDMTPLHEAGYRGHSALYQDLAKHPASAAILQQRDLLGRTPAEYMENPI